MNRARLNIVIVMLVFASMRLQAQVISNNGATISISSGTVVVSHDLTNTSATLRNFGTLNLSGNFTNSVLSTTSGNGFFRIGGNWSNAGSFLYGTSTVLFNGLGDQSIITPSPETFYNFSIENSGASSGFNVKLENSVQVMGTLTMNTGNIMTSNHILYLYNSTPNSLYYTSGIIFGRFERGISATGRYLFPLGNISRPSYYNPATLIIRAIYSSGSVLGEFINSPPGNAGLPLNDISVSPEVEIDSAFTAGYWSMTAKNSFSTSNFNIELGAEGFTNATDIVRENTRVIKRINGNDWTLDGIHVDATDDVVKRDNLTGNISASETQFALGQANPLITGHPQSLIVCEHTNPSFTVTASGSEPFTYIWYKDGAIIPPGDPHYTGSRLATLTINGATLADAGTYYCVVRDRFLSTTTSNEAMLTVNKTPVANAFPLMQNHACSEIPFQEIVLSLSHYDIGTRFVWSRETHANILTTVPTSGTEYNIGDILSGGFNNTSDAPITITFTIVPIGPGTTQCEGEPVYSSVTVNPKPRINPVISEICYGSNAVINLVSDTELTMPKENALRFGYRAYTTSSAVSGIIDSQSNMMYGSVISRQYSNSDNTSQSIFYKIVPVFTSDLGCNAGDSTEFEIKIHAQPLQSLAITKHLTCDGGDDASMLAITSLGAGGANGYFFKWFRNNMDWSEGYNLNVLTNKRGGSWNVTVTDNLGCSNSLDIFVPPGSKLAPYMYVPPVDATSVYATSCNGSADGQIWLRETIQSTGTAPFEYWVVQNGQDTASTSLHGFIDDKGVYTYLTGLTAGRYTLYMRDANGCYNTEVQQRQISEPEIITATFELNNVSSAGNSDGEVWIKEIKGGNGGYSYEWKTINGVILGNSNKLENIPAGTYYLNITDSKNCTKTESVVITEPPPQELSLHFDIKDITCTSGIFNDGAITVTVSGGVAPYSYVWSNGRTTKDISGLTENVYTVKVTDRYGATITGSASVSNPPSLTYTSQVSNYNGFNISCFNMSNGYININMTGGTPPYMFIWTGPDDFVATTQNISGLKSGRYTLQITDDLGCTVNQIFNLTQPNQLRMNITVSTSLNGRYNINCAGSKTGYIEIQPAGGVGKVDLLWSDGIYGNRRENLPAGYYSVIITDLNGCYSNSSIMLTEPDPININFKVTEPFCSDMPDGSVTAEVKGGVVTGDYNYRWSDNSINRSLTNITAGWYSVAVEDFNGCIARDSIKVEAQNSSCLDIPNAISPNGDLINDVWIIGNIHLYLEAEVRIFDRWGNVVWVSGKGYPIPWDGTREGRALPIDSYHYIIDLKNGERPIIGTITIIR